MSRHFKAFDILSNGDRTEFEALLREPATTVDRAFEWMQERGYRISRGAVHNAKRNFADVLGSVKRSSEMAAAYSALARDGSTDLAEATVQRFQQVLMRRLMDVDEEQEMETKELVELSAAVKNGVLSKAATVKMLAEKFDREMQKTAAKKEITGEDIAEARKRIFGV